MISQAVQRAADAMFTNYIEHGVEPTLTDSNEELYFAFAARVITLRLAQHYGKDLESTPEAIAQKLLERFEK